MKSILEVTEKLRLDNDCANKSLEITNKNNDDILKTVNHLKQQFSKLTDNLHESLAQNFETCAKTMSKNSNIIT